MSNKKLEDFSHEMHLEDQPDFPIQIGDPVIMRSDASGWVPCIYMGYTETSIDPYHFRSGEGWHSMVAPMLGNEDAIGTGNDVFGLIDIDWMQERGLIEKD